MRKIEVAFGAPFAEQLVRCHGCGKHTTPSEAYALGDEVYCPTCVWGTIIRLEVEKDQLQEIVRDLMPATAWTPPTIHTPAEGDAVERVRKAAQTARKIGC